MSIQESDFEITDNHTSNVTHINAVETLNVTINKSVMLCIDASAGDISIRVWPISKGEIWDAPHEEFTVDLEEIEKLEKEMEG